MLEMSSIPQLVVNPVVDLLLYSHMSSSRVTADFYTREPGMRKSTETPEALTFTMHLNFGYPSEVLHSSVHAAIK